MAKQEDFLNSQDSTVAESLAIKPDWRPRAAGRPQGWLALLFFALATVAFTWPLAIKLWDYLPDWGDPPDVAWKMGFIARNLLENPLNINRNPFFYPLTDSIALNELLTGLGFLGAPVIWLTGNTTLAFNLLNFTSFWLSGFSMWLLVRHLTGSFGAGIVAGLVFAFSPWHYGQYGHLPLTAQQWMIFSLYFLIRFLENTRPGTVEPWRKRHWWGLALFVFFFVLQALSAGYFAYFEAILVGCYLVYYFAVRSGLARYGLIFLRRNQALDKAAVRKPDWRRLGQQAGLVAGAGGLALLLILPFVLPSLRYQQEFGFKRQLSEVSYWSAAPTSLLRMSDRSWLYNPVQRGIFDLQTSVEREMYPGMVTVGLAAAGLVGAVRRRRPVYWLFLFVAMTGLILSFGPALNLEAYGLHPTGIPLPYKWLYELVPGFSALRVSQRFGQLFMLGLAVCAGFGTAYLAGLRPKFSLKPGGWWKPALQFGLAGLVALEFFAPGLPAQPTPTGENAPALYRWLAGPEARQVIGPKDLLLELPMGTTPTPITSSPIYLFYAQEHRRPMLNGSANILPAGYDRLYYEMQSFPAPATLDIIEGLGVKFVVVHTRELAADANRAELEKQAGPGGRLEAVRSFADPADSRFKEVVYRVKPDPQRFQRFAELIPAGSSVFLADTNSRRRLYTYTLAGLIGPDRRYFAPFASVYSGQVGGVQLAQPKQTFEYAIFYRSGGPSPADYGFSPADIVAQDALETVVLYRKK
jgi:hypothetical protein